MWIFRSFTFAWSKETKQNAGECTQLKDWADEGESTVNEEEYQGQKGAWDQRDYESKEVAEVNFVRVIPFVPTPENDCQYAKNK